MNSMGFISADFSLCYYCAVDVILSEIQVPRSLWRVFSTCVWHLGQIFQCCFILLTTGATTSNICYYTYFIHRTSVFIYVNIYSWRTRFGLRPESKRNDGAWFSFTHCDWHSLILIHQVVFVWVTVNTHHKTVKQAAWIDSIHWLIYVQIQICLCRVVQMSYFLLFALQNFQLRYWMRGNAWLTTETGWGCSCCRAGSWQGWLSWWISPSPDCQWSPASVPQIHLIKKEMK